MNGSGLHQMVFEGVARCRRSGGDAELAVDRTHVEIDRDQANHELLGNLRAGQALSQQAQHIQLARRKPGSSGWRRHDGSRRW